MSEQTLVAPETVIDGDVDAVEPGDEPAPTETEPAQAEPPPAPAKRRSSSRSRSGGKASVRRIADKAEQISDADEEIRDLAAELIGARSAGIADLTTAIMEAKKSPVQTAVADLAGVQSGSVPEATVHLVGMDRSSLTMLVALVGALSETDLPAKLPAKSVDAALVLVEPVREARIDQDALDRLQDLLAR